MQLTNEQIIEYQKLYKQRFGVDISNEHAYEEGMKLINLMKLVCKPIMKEEYINLQECRRRENVHEA